MLKLNPWACGSREGNIIVDKTKCRYYYMYSPTQKETMVRILLLLLWPAVIVGTIGYLVYQTVAPGWRTLLGI